MPEESKDSTKSAEISPEKTDLYIGTILSGRYKIEKQIGRGGIGVVYLARDKQLISRPVVIKVLLEDTYQNEWFKKKFQNEIEALARIDHPSVVGILDTGQTPEGEPYIVMQYVEGITLSSLITPQGMELKRVANIVRQAGQALTVAHDKGVYHRDLKPPNIMIQSLGEGEELVKLIDFGIATVKNSQLAGSSTQTKVAGTVAYMAPEQLIGEPSPASDIYSLGVLAYEMLTGHLPFSPRSPVELYEMQRRGVQVKPRQHRYSLPEAAQEIILKALSFNPENRQERAREFGDSLAQVLTAGAKTSDSHLPINLHSTITVASDQAFAFRADAKIDLNPELGASRLAILYKRNVQPDGQVLRLLEKQMLASGYEVFIDQHLTVGLEWAREIERQVRSSDAVIILISAASITSEMLAYEVQIAHEAAQKQAGKPRLLPVRVDYDGPLPDHLAVILDPIQYAIWEGPQDDDGLVEELLNSLRTPPSTVHRVIPRKLEAIGGAVPLDSQFYIVRSTDAEFRSAIARQDSIVLVKGARQMGKTSILARGLQQARQAGARVVLTDFQMLNTSHLESIDKLFITLAELIADQLDLDVLPDEVWNSARGASINFGRYFRREVLGKITEPLIWGLDEVDRLFTCDFGSEVFGLFRSWHNARSLDPKGPWQRLTLAIAYATEAHLFITDVNQSPFNVGTRLVLEDFSLEQVEELNRRYGSPLRDRAEVARFFRLVSGQPYLVRRGLHELAAHNTGLTEFESKADRDEGPFGDHLRRMLVLLAQDAALCEVVRGVLQGQPCPTAESFYRLRSAGVLSGETARDARPRCQLYATYLERHLL